ncbi:MAG: Hint domain-containing protein [Acetobacter malorum]|uniref:Hint domain-containing protein n=1 Tax=Acetobacter malorum TaxID=178901 RepID=UPI0039E759C4
MSEKQIYSNENNVTVTSGNTLQILAGTVSGLTVNNGGKVYNYSTVNNAVLQSGANFENDYKTTSGLTAQSGSELTFLGGNGYNLTLQNGAHGSAIDKAVLSGVTINDAAKLTVLNGTVASAVTVSASGDFTGQTAFEVGNGASAYNVSVVNNTTLVDSGAVVSNTTLDNFGALLVKAGGSANVTTVGSNGQLAVAGSATNTTVNRTGMLEIAGGGIATQTTVLSGQVVVDSGGTLNSATVSGASINGNGTSVYSVIVSGGATMSAVTVGDWGTLQVSAGGSAINTTVNSRGGLALAGSATGTTINTSGVLDVATGGRADNNTITPGGEIYVEPSATLGDTSIASTGILSVASGGTISGVVTLQAGGSATIWNNAGGSVVLPTDANHGLTISGLENGGTVSTVINGFTGTAPGNSDSIDLAGVSADGVSYAYPSDDQVVVTLANKATITLNIPGVKNTGFELTSDGHGGAFGEVCFLAGSMIQTPDGDVAVEELRQGDTVLSYAQGIAQPASVKWTGKARTTVRAGLHADEAGYPVRIRKDALSDGVPCKDLLVTPEHSLFLKGRFVPARMLVNGISIVYDTSISSYDYYHVETEQHAVICADGALTESYLDTGNRSTFRQEGSVVTLHGTRQSWEQDAAAPLCVERSFVELIFQELEARGTVLFGHASSPLPVQVTHDPDLHLVTDKAQVLRPVRHEGGQYTFMLPPNTEHVRLISRTSRPSDVVGPFVDDRRELGVAIGSMTLVAGQQKQDIVAHLQPVPPQGWYARHEDASSVWTNGCAILPVSDSTRGKVCLLSLTVCAAGPYAVAEDNTATESLSA